MPTAQPLVTLALVALAFAACGLGGISQERAEELALAGSADEVIWIESGPLGRYADRGTLPDEPRDRWVWAVLVHGSFPGSCVIIGAGVSKCPPDATSELVVLDYHTGDFIYAETR